nr:NUDIX domain-containing protein [Rufibacter roseus]
MLVAVDCIIFGFDGNNFKILLAQKSFAPEKDKYSLMGGFIWAEETVEEAAQRILKRLTGLEGVYLDQIHTFSAPGRDPVERTISVAFVALIDIHKYEKQIIHEYNADWFLLQDKPKLIFDHDDMVDTAKKYLRYKAAMHPLLFELLPEKFTLPQLQALYEGLYETSFDKRNFSRKVLSAGILIRLDEKEKESSKKGAYYFTLDKNKYLNPSKDFLNLIPNPEKHVY